MIGYLKGKIISKKPTKLLLDVNGVGYNLNISINTFEKIGDVGETCELHTYLNVKEDALDLYGFASEGEKEMYQVLIKVNGVGPKLALNILSGIQFDELKEAINTSDVSRIVAVPGIGRKTAERLVIELKDKVDAISDSESHGAAAGSFTVRSDAVAALVTLGYNPKTVNPVVRKVLDSNPQISIEDLIKESLAMINK
jgi:Holliday junction DNA helicase RuvA